MALVDLSDPSEPVVLNAAPVGVGTEGIKFFHVGNRLLVACASEVSGTVSILEVVFSRPLQDAPEPCDSFLTHVSTSRSGPVTS